MLPLAAPALAAVAILTFQGMWNEFFWANCCSVMPGPARVDGAASGCRSSSASTRRSGRELMAAATLAILPVLIIYIFFQRYFVAGVAAAGVKG